MPVLTPKDIKYIVVHESDSPFGDVAVIREWHTTPPRNWDDIAYHYVITNAHPKSVKVTVPNMDGKVSPGRPRNKWGAHCVGYNQNSIGVCLIGAKGVYTPAQMSALRTFLHEQMAKYSIPVANVIGHCESASGKKEGKTCPELDMVKLRADLSSGVI